MALVGLDESRTRRTPSLCRLRAALSRVLVELPTNPIGDDKVKSGRDEHDDEVFVVCVVNEPLDGLKSNLSINH